MRKPRRRNLHSGRLAKVNHFYSPDEVQALYGVCRNTVGNWLRSGLCCFENGSRRLFRGDQLNDFHRARRDRSKSPCGLYEIHCVSCGGKHSLLEGGLTVHPGRTGLVRLSLACSEGRGRASRWMTNEQWAVIKDATEHNPNGTIPD
ncbi:helix-turn-helix domain-containing protein [Rhizobium sp. CECT 9324]|uniref:helix-turn-helix domain-containing protein n=1 Tax=Rhizobium sp. CECT 9324 TaxID=2845820 RepID=UPI001EF9C66C|nr:hypothetical protein RHI9324_00252 [Rhizobium sp. CECT 9324]